MKTTYVILVIMVIAGLMFMYALLKNSPADRFGAGSRLGSASSDVNFHRMNTETLNKMPRYKHYMT